MDFRGYAGLNEEKRQDIAQGAIADLSYIGAEDDFICVATGHRVVSIFSISILVNRFNCGAFEDALTNGGKGGRDSKAVEAGTVAKSMSTNGF